VVIFVVFRLGDPRASAAAKLSPVGRDPVGCGRKSFAVRSPEETERRVALMRAARLNILAKIRPKTPQEAEAIKVQLNLSPDATPLELLSRIYVNDDLPVHLRITAAATAAPYVHARVVLLKARPPEEEATTITIEDGFPPLPGAPVEEPSS
jgi:hypothetical protein